MKKTELVYRQLLFEALEQHVLRALIEWLWEENDLDITLPKTMLNTLIFGNAFWKMVYDTAARGGLGDISVLNVDPTHIFVNPEATSMRDVEELYHVEVVSMAWLRERYPDQAERVRPGVRDHSILIDRRQFGQAPAKGGTFTVRETSATGAVFEYPSGSKSAVSDIPKDVVTVYERWKRDVSAHRWRKTVVANEVLLEDELTDAKMVPFVHFIDYPLPWTFWGTGEIQHVENLQYEINKRRGMILDILRFCAMPMLVIDPASGLDTDNLEAMPSLVLPVEGGPSAAGWLVPQMDLGGLFGVNDRDKQDFNDILGNVDIIQGKRPVGIEAAAALEALSEAANTRIRLKVRLMEASLRRAGRILVELIQRHYTSQRIFRIVGREFTESGQAAAPQSPDFFAINKPVGVSDTGEPEFENAIPPDAEFDIRIGAGSTLPVSRTARFQQGITLYDRKAIDRKELLKNSGWPRWEEVDERMAQAEQAAAGAMEGTSPDEASIPETIEELMGQQAEIAPAAEEEGAL